MTVTIDKFGRVLIPKALRDRLGLKPGTPLQVGVRDAGDGAPTLEIRPEPEEPTFVREHGRLVYAGEVGGVDVAEILRSERDERARRHAGLDGDERDGDER